MMLGMPMGQPGAMPPTPPQPPTPGQLEMLDKPSWEQVIAVLRDNAHRNFRIDIETDSTIAGSLESDMTGLKDVLTGVTNFVEGVMPAVQSGMLPIEAVKEIVATITRRARMGMAVEDSLDKIQAPTPPADPNAGKLQMDQQRLQAQTQLQQQQQQHEQQMETIQQQVEQQRIAMEAQHTQQQATLDAQVEQHKQQLQAQQVARQNELEAQREAQRAQNEMALEQMRIFAEKQSDLSNQQFDLLITRLNNANKIEVAEVTKSTQLELKQMEAANEAAQNSDDRAISDDTPAALAEDQ